MEADINEPCMQNIEMNLKDHQQGQTQEMICEDHSGSGCFPILATSTPLAEKDEDRCTAHIPSLQSNDSGFSDGTFMSTPASSVNGTPCTSLVSPLSDAPLSQTQTSLPDCNITPILRKRLPARTRKYRHSDPSLHSLALQINFIESKDTMLKLSQSETACSGKGEKEGEVTNEIENITSITEKSLRRNLLREVANRSRSSSRSLSSASDELEASFQEMSLEESSSDSMPSPSSRTSSPSFVFPSSSSLSRSQSPPADVNVIDNNTSDSEIRDETLIPSCDKVSISLASETILAAPNDVVSAPYLKDELSSIDIKPAEKLAFAASLSLSPTPHTLETGQKILSSSSTLVNKTVSEDEHRVCDSDMVSPSSKLCTSCPPHNISTHQSQPRKSDASLFLTLSPPQASTASLTSPTQEACCSSLSPPGFPTYVNPLLKSPTKRISNGQCSQSSISPHKMRRKMGRSSKAQNLTPQNVKRDLSSGFLSSSQGPSNQLERSPQYLNINFPPDVLFHEDHSQSSNHIAGTHVCDNEDSRKLDNQSDRLQRIIEIFSPPEPSRLIGRRVGLVKCDIIGELYKQNFLLCLETIFKYLPDSDLIRVINVSELWHSSLEGDSKAFLRYKKLRQAQRKVKLLPGKENAIAKPKDSSGPSVTGARGPLSALSTIQQQATSLEIPSPESEEDVDLMWDDIRRICPTCYRTALIHPAENRATCQRGSCGYEFCTLCFSAFHHPKPCKPLFPAASKADLAGTRKSKKNLRRL